MNGIDISKYQSNNYKYLIDNFGTDFVICRAAWRYTVDSMCDTIYQYAKSKGKKLGVYFFPLTSDGEPEKHAEWAYQQILGYINEAIIILDWEYYSGAEGKLDPSNVTWAKQWLDKMYDLSGVKPMIYMNSNCNLIYNFQTIADSDYGLWIANYGNNDGTDHGRPSVKWWKSAAMHQYTSLGNNGQSLDRDKFYGDKTAWDKYAKSTKTSTPVPFEKTYTEAEVKVIKANYEKQLDTLRQVAANLQVINKLLSEWDK